MRVNIGCPLFVCVVQCCCQGFEKCITSQNGFCTKKFQLAHLVGIGIRWQEDLRGWMIKQRVAQIRWGMSAGGRVLAAYDPEMEQALGLLNRAESLLASRTRRVDRERTYLPSSGSSGHGQVR